MDYYKFLYQFVEHFLVLCCFIVNVLLKSNNHALCFLLVLYLSSLSCILLLYMMGHYLTLCRCNWQVHLYMIRSFGIVISNVLELHHHNLLGKGIFFAHRKVCLKVVLISCRPSNHRKTSHLQQATIFCL